MKDYSLNRQEQTNFIKNYRLKKGTIISNLPRGKKHYTPYSPENEERIQWIMKAQTRDLGKRRKAFLGANLGYTLLLAISLLAMITSVTFALAAETVSFLQIAFSVGTAASALFFAGKEIQTQNVLNDMAKTKFFLDNESELNNNIRNNCNMTLNLPAKMVQVVNSKSEEEPVFDINSIDVDGWTLEQLRTIKENIEREEYYALDYEPEDEEMTPDSAQGLRLIPRRKR